MRFVNKVLKNLFQEVFKIAHYVFLEVTYVCGGAHVVAITWIDEEVGMLACIYALTEEGEGMLWHTGWVIASIDEEQTALEVLCLAKQGGSGIAVRIGLRSIHIAFSVHHFVVFPVDYRSTCHSCLEDIGIGGISGRGGIGANCRRPYFCSNSKKADEMSIFLLWA